MLYSVQILGAFQDQLELEVPVGETYTAPLVRGGLAM